MQKNRDIPSSQINRQDITRTGTASQSSLAEYYQYQAAQQLRVALLYASLYNNTCRWQRKDPFVFPPGWYLPLRCQHSRVLHKYICCLRHIRTISPAWSHIKPGERAIEVSHTACKDEFRRNPRSQACMAMGTRQSKSFFFQEYCLRKTAEDILVPPP